MSNAEHQKFTDPPEQPSPIDTIRKTLLGDVPATEWDHFRDDALAALTQVEHQLEDEYRRGYDEGYATAAEAHTNG